MAKIIWTEPAIDQLDDIAEYIALDNPAAANSLVVKVFKVVDRLERFRTLERAARIPDHLSRSLCSTCRILYRRQEGVLILDVRRRDALRKYFK